MTRTIAVFGASGHVGGTLIERLLARGGYDVRPVIRKSGNAWRLARRGIRLWSADLARRDEIREAVAGCDVVVNCSYPSGDQMESSVANLTAECLAANVKRYIHISSIAVYGEFPSQAAEHESAPDRAPKGTYGYYKLKQDAIVERAVRRGLPSVVLCPPNITGINSKYVFDILDALRRGALPLVGDGQSPCVLVDVVNLAAAIELAFDRGSGDGQRIFINDDEPTTWREVVEALWPIVGDVPAVRTIDEEEARKFVASQRDGYSVSQAMRKIAGIAEIKRIVKQTPTLLRWAKRCKQWSKYGPGPVRRLMEGGPRTSAASASILPMSRFVAHQLRGVRHRCDRARQELGYRPEVSFAESRATFCRWYEAYCGFGRDEWRLLAELYRRSVS